MTSIGQAADELISTKMKNIADLQKVDVNEEIYNETKTNAANEKYEVYWIEREGYQYRIPYSVLDAIKLLRREVKEGKTEPFEHFKVIKTGTTKDDTKYSIRIL